MNQIDNIQDQPLISVIIRTQNRPHLLREALQSIAQQTYPFVEAVVVNDGGESVKHIVKPFESLISSGLQLIEKTTKEGRSAAGNTGIESAKGEWIAFLDDDDIFEPNGLEQLAQYIKWDKDIIYGQVNVWQMSVLNEENKRLTVMKEYEPDSLWLCNQIAICAYICKKENALKIGSFDCEFDYLEDWDFYFRLSQNARVQYVPQIVANYRVWGGGFITGQNNHQESIYRQKFFEKHHSLFSPEILLKISVNNIQTLNEKSQELHTYCRNELDKQHAAFQNEIDRIQAALHENLEQLKQYKEIDSKLFIAENKLKVTEQQLHNFQNQANHLYGQNEYHKRQWPIRFHQVLNRLMLHIAFDGREEIINLNALGLTIPTQVFAAKSSTVYSAIPIFQDIKFAAPITKGKILQWELNWQQEIQGHSIALQLGTYCRVNHCQLKLIMIPQDNQGDIVESYIEGKYVEDNEYMAFPLNKPLFTGRYLCELSSPNTDNNQHLLGVWLTTNHRVLGAQIFRSYIYQFPNRVLLEEELLKLTYRPLISILIPTYNTNEKFLRECLDSVVNQVYQNWELCIADDASKEPQVIKVLEEYRERFPTQIKLVFCEENRHISATTNAALEVAEGEFVALLDHDDLLTEDALFEVVKLLNQKHEKQVDVIYSDEDKWSDVTNCFDEPFFKPDWSPENLKGQMYIGHLGIYRRNLVEEVGGFRLGLEGSQDWDLALRVTEKAQSICHIPKILYHWRKHSNSTAQHANQKNYAVIAGLKAVNDALERENEGGIAHLNDKNNCVLVQYPIKNKPLVSIVIPTKDKAELLKPCLVSLVKNTSYPNFEIVIVDNGSSEPETFQLFEEYQQLLEERFKVIRDDDVFNFSRLVNNGVKASSGEMILMLNNDTEVISPNNWLEEMIGYAQRKEIACVGCKLLYDDQTIQHAGVICGLGGIASHSHLNLPVSSPGYYARLTIVSNYSATTGACFMIRRSVWEEVNGFDETLAVAYNDVDFCLRLLSKNYRHVVLPHVLFYHHESKSRGLDNTPEKQRRFTQETNLMKQRWQHIIDHDPYYNPNLTLYAADFSISPDSPYYCETNEEALP
jgi:glycosyltransferase involved in cell wall biosynthesis